MRIIHIEDAKTKFFLSKEQYLTFKKQWAKLAQEKKITATGIIFYNLLRGKPSNRGFTPIKKESKLLNGAKPDEAYEEALCCLINYADSLVTGKNKWVRDAAEQLFLKNHPETITLGMLSSFNECLRRTP